MVNFAVILTQTKHKFTTDGRTDLLNKVQAYRSGYLAAERRQIEEQLFSGKLLGVTATTALELGVDVGGLDATVHVGYPGSIASMWQQAGRAGRGGQPCLSIIIGMNSGLDQHYMNNPASLFDEKSEEVAIDPFNDAVLLPQLTAAAHEHPLHAAEGDENIFDQASQNHGHFRRAVTLLEEQQILRNVICDPSMAAEWQHVGDSLRPCADCNLRGTMGVKVKLVANGKTVEEVDETIGKRQAHEGAVYMHQSQSYLVLRLDLDRNVAEAERADQLNYYTESKSKTTVSVVDQQQQITVGATAVSYGKLRISEQVVSFIKKQIFTDVTTGEAPLDLPPTEFESDGLWFELPQELCDFNINMKLFLLKTTSSLLTK